MLMTQLDANRAEVAVTCCIITISQQALALFLSQEIYCMYHDFNSINHLSAEHDYLSAIYLFIQPPKLETVFIHIRLDVHI